MRFSMAAFYLKMYNRNKFISSLFHTEISCKLFCVCTHAACGRQSFASASKILIILFPLFISPDSIVIGFWVGLAVFVIFMFFVLTLLTKTGAPHQE